LTKKARDIFGGGFDDWKDVEIGPKHTKKRQSHDKVAQSGVCDKDKDRARVSAGALKVSPLIEERSLSHIRSLQDILKPAQKKLDLITLPG